MHRIRFFISLFVGVSVGMLGVLYFTNIFIYVVISLVLSTMLRPLANSLSRVQLLGVRMPRVVAIVLSFVVLSLLISVFGFLFVPLISEQVKVLASVNYEHLFLKITNPLEELEGFLINNHLTAQEKGFIVADMQESLREIVRGVDFPSLFNDILSITGNFFVGGLSVFFITFFLLLENGLIRNIFIRLVPNAYFEMYISAFYKIEKLLTNYLLGLVLQMLSVFSIVSVGLSMVGIKYALTIGVFAAFANLIPYLGPVLGATFGVIVGISIGVNLVEFNDYLLLMLKILGVFAVVQITDNFVLQPLIFSKSVKAHPLEIFIIIFAGANLAGIPGMIGAIPVYTILRVSYLEISRGYRKYYIFKKN
ncbi:MAG: AI-2E family transporter [Cytophagales bacterium]|nr:AI-2E family transporter [Cytophagales bacterium]